jgi:DNA-binding transcriptional MerR regulator
VRRPVPADARSLSIGDVAQRLGVSVDTLRYYEKEGLVTPARDPAGRRRYGAADVAALEVVRMLRDAGLGIDPIRRVLAVKRRGGSHDARLRRAEAVLRSVRADIEERRDGLDRAARAVDGWLGDVRDARR